MSTRTITETDCDVRGCGKKNVPVRSLSFHTGDTLDPAGGRSEKINKSFDVCAECMSRMVKELCASLTYAAAEMFSKSGLSTRSNTDRDSEKKSLGVVETTA
jgi:hypothetical protein